MIERLRALFNHLAARGSVKKGLALLDKLDTAFAKKSKQAIGG